MRTQQEWVLQRSSERESREVGPRGGGGGGQGQRQTWAGLPGRACCCKRGREGRRQGDWRPVPGVVVPGVHSSHQPCFRKAPRTDTSRPLLGMPHLLPALAYGDGVGWGGRALQWLHFLGLRPNISLSLRQSCPRVESHQATGPVLLQRERERESRMSEGVGTAWLGKAGRRPAGQLPERQALWGVE